MSKQSTFGATVATASSILLMGLSVTAQADSPSFNFVQIDYVLSGEVDIGAGFVGAKLDANDGFGLKGAFEIGELFFVSAEMLDVNYDDKFGEFNAAGESVIVTDSSFVGGGAHFPIADVAELYGEVGLVRATFTSYVGTGFGFKIGARANLGIAEVGAWYQKSQTDFKAGNTTVDYDPDAMGLDVALTFSEAAPQLVLGYAEATYELGIPATPSTDVDIDSFTIGVRKTF
ncbi:MAG: hypothetical protein KBT87_06880 [Gammaproteobacteria bacterium]|jgi:hypothetical protein|nr:hypothetical protein [Gammaproteobacteria bacterium]MBQ0774377.1 hypothetical protein [Gammaproteobacteria bacterium]